MIANLRYRRADPEPSDSGAAGALDFHHLARRINDRRPAPAVVPQQQDACGATAAVRTFWYG
jgi:hypothetical protein